VQIPAIIDIEASGFGRGSYPIEVGFALPDRTSYSFLIKPAQSWTHWSDEAEKIHGLSRELLQKEGLPMKDVAYELNRVLADRVLYSDAWSFDSSWLGRIFEEAGIVQRFRLETITTLLSQKQLEIWHATKEHIWQERGIKGRHRAARDVEVLQETYVQVIQQCS
jgi:DNA polymerase III epsilon subunit-like protein